MIKKILKANFVSFVLMLSSGNVYANECTETNATLGGSSDCSEFQSVSKTETPLVAECRSSLLTTFPQTAPQIDSITESLIPGVCEIIAGTNVLYFLPRSNDGLFIFGNIVDNKNHNFTMETVDAVMAKKIDSLPMSSAVEDGTGPIQVVVFTDVDCPYCRTLEKALSENETLKEKATIHSFLWPLDMHPEAKLKSEWVLCQANPSEALNKAMVEGEVDFVDSLQAEVDKCTNDEIKERLAAGIVAGKKIGVQSTPTIYVNGRRVRGDAKMVIATIEEAYAGIRSLTSQVIVTP